MKKKVVLFLSGGPDSAVAAYHLHHEGYEVHALTMANNERGTNCVEVACAQGIVDNLGISHTVLDISNMGGLFDGSNHKIFLGGDEGNCQRRGLVQAPMCNSFMQMSGLMYALSRDIDTLVWCVHANDYSGDGQTRVREYIALIERMVAVRENRRAYIKTPFLEMSKAEVLRLGQKLGVPFDLTFSCNEREDSVHCGTCKQCENRIQAFREAGFEDSASYAEKLDVVTN